MDTISGVHHFPCHQSVFFYCLSGIDNMFEILMQEIITAGHYQNLYPNPCKHVRNNSVLPTIATSDDNFHSQTEEGVFGSKFVTVCITGNKDCEVEMVAYQVKLFTCWCIQCLIGEITFNCR